ncbi:MAG TPA: aminomethyl-transferring glycine dehydrogenase subunit GcvPA [Gammaproteobacteria bacterium]|nr:aminomethyl-transferring glycine dehydrogenase subunit GcvPA [Gammaproteobacteria bacterium]
MPFIPHTEEDVREMLAAVGVGGIGELFDEIPRELRIETLQGVPAGLGEMEVSRLMRERAAGDGAALSFLGAGAYEHHIPAAVWELATRGEFYSSYTPYQAEASQGTLQLIYEFQSMMSALTGLAVSNASLYDGASALAEAALMALRIKRKDTTRRILVPAALNPHYKSVLATICGPQEISFHEIAWDPASGRLSERALADAPAAAALVVAQPNFLGVIEDSERLARHARERELVLIGAVNPTPLALLTPPGAWGDAGADIACGEGQPLGVPMSSGGPYFGFMTCRKEHVRQLPGRIVGRTTDAAGRGGFALTLQAREQHIRRSKATSNICTNQGLAVTAATIYMALLGPAGLRAVAAASHARCRELLARCEAAGGARRFTAPFFHEAAIAVGRDAGELLARMLAADDIIGGYDLAGLSPELSDSLLVCATETKTSADLERYGASLGAALAQPARAQA